MKQIIKLSDKAATRIKEVLSKDEKSLGVLELVLKVEDALGCHM